ncbi:unnamed protein product [Callosobruchus maculatus]|uniref:Uncharacterized protein n=1 Tax=Callosobruchus maculatus TaxID=64391 RepID=A0A653CTH5_CALMS|nr:unnamed protein product [Callosobruchus maculatus]
MDVHSDKTLNIRMDFKSQENDCLREFEEASKICLPNFLKNILKFNAFNNAAILRDISDKDIEDIEKFMVSETALDLIAESEYEQFYGVFHRNPKKFKFLLGHKKLLLSISQFFKAKFEKEVAGFTTGLGGGPGRSGSTTLPLVISQSNNQENRDKDVNGPSRKSSKLATDLAKENIQVSQTMRKWINSKCTDDEQLKYFKQKFSYISFETSLNFRDDLCCTMTCYCMKKLQILKSAQKPGYSDRWVYGNFHKHMTKHFSLYEQSKCTSSNQLVPGKIDKPQALSANTSSDKKQQGIMKYITVTGSSNRNQNNLILNCNEQPAKQSNDLSREYSNTAENGPLPITTSDTSDEVVTQDAVSLAVLPRVLSKAQPEINILSNLVVVEAMVHSNTDKGPSIDLLAKNEDVKLGDEKRCENLIRDETPATSVSKWKSEKYQRTARARRHLQSKIINQPVISSFFTLLSNIEKEVESTINNIVQVEGTKSISSRPGDKLNMAIKELSQCKIEPTANHRSQLLKMLIDISIQNTSSSSSHYHYTDVVKQFSLYLYYVGGRMLYETIYANMKGILPSITTLNNYITNNGEKIEEGVFDYDGLCRFLEERNLPKVVWISEDGTRVTGKIEYDSRSNKVVGFTLPLVDGLPQTSSFLATSAKAIQDYFLTSSKANYAYIVMAQPLSKFAPPHCLVVFRTDNRFDASDVTKRWKHIKESLKKRGILLLGFSSDGDTRLLKAMRQHAKLQAETKPQDNDRAYKWEWFQAGYKKDDVSDVFYVQDTVHIATKLRTRFLNPKVTLTIGSFTATPKHLEQLINDFSKDQHLLTASDLKAEDKMCFKSAEKMCSESVINLLKSKPGCEGTIAYLKIMQFAIASLLDFDLDVNQRLYKLWFCVFFLRIWRKWIADHPSLKIGNNFITSNCYLCIELNAHALINICTNFRDNPNLTNDMFLPHLFSSQTCEKVFRATRSMTTTNSTVVNYSIKDIIRRLDRISTINNIITDLHGVMVFPREEKKSAEESCTTPSATTDLKGLSDEAIQISVEKALHDALELTESLGIKVPEGSWNYIAAELLTPVVVEDETENDCDMASELNVTEGDGSEFLKASPLEHRQCTENTDLLPDSESAIPGDIDTDICSLNIAGIGQELLLKDFSVNLIAEGRDTVDEKGPLVRVTVEGGKSTIIKKSSLCWLLEETTQRVSSDRLRRFFTSKPEKKSNASSHGSCKRKTRILWNNNKLPEKRRRRDIPKKSKSGFSKTCKKSSTVVSESSDDDDLSIKYADTTDTEVLSDETSDSNEYSSKHETTLMTSSPVGGSSTPKFEHSVQTECGKFYAIYYEQRWYLGLVTKILNDECVVKFLKKKRKREFLWPKPDDICSVLKEFIFYGPIDINKGSDIPLELTDLQLKQINSIYLQMKRR